MMKEFRVKAKAELVPGVCFTPQKKSPLAGAA